VGLLQNLCKASVFAVQGFDVACAHLLSFSHLVAFNVEITYMLHSFVPAARHCWLQLTAWTGNGLLRLLEEQLDPALYTSLAAAAADDSGSSSSSSVAAEQQQQHLKARLVGLLYATANLCSVSEVHREAVVASKIPALLLQHVSARSSSSSSSSSRAAPAAWLQEVRLAAVWCVINMLWSEAGTAAAAAGSDAAAAAAGEAAASSAAAAGRIAALKRLGYEDALKSILAQSTGPLGVTAAAADQPSPSAAAAAAGVSVPLPPPLPADAYSQDLCERLQTALEQLGVK
jgi:uncharacterized protein (DUF2237 family)